MSGISASGPYHHPTIRGLIGTLQVEGNSPITLSLNSGKGDTLIIRGGTTIDSVGGFDIEVKFDKNGRPFDSGFTASCGPNDWPDHRYLSLTCRKLSSDFGLEIMPRY